LIGLGDELALHTLSVMAGLDPATQLERGSATWGLIAPSNNNESFRRADARRLGGRVKPGHDDLKVREHSA
jgi:hypothetical protein